MQSPDLHRLRTKNDRTGDIARKVRKNISRERERTRTYDRQLDDRLADDLHRQPGPPPLEGGPASEKSLFFGGPDHGTPEKGRGF